MLIIIGAGLIGVGIFYLIEWRFSTKIVPVGEIAFRSLNPSDLQDVNLFFKISDGRNARSLLKTDLHLRNAISLNNGSASLYADYVLFNNEENSNTNCGSYFLNMTDFETVRGFDSPRVSFNWSRLLCSPENSEVPPGIFSSFFINDQITSQFEGTRTFTLNFESPALQTSQIERTIEIQLPRDAVIIPESVPNISRLRSDENAVYAQYEIQKNVSFIALSYYLPEELQEYNTASFFSGVFIGLGISACFTGIERRLQTK